MRDHNTTHNTMYHTEFTIRDLVVRRVLLRRENFLVQTRVFCLYTRHPIQVYEGRTDISVRPNRSNRHRHCLFLHHLQLQQRTMQSALAIEC